MAQFQVANWQYLKVLLRGSIICTTSDNLIVFYLRLERTSKVNRWQQIYLREKNSNPLYFAGLPCRVGWEEGKVFGSQILLQTCKDPDLPFFPASAGILEWVKYSWNGKSNIAVSSLIINITQCKQLMLWRAEDNDLLYISWDLNNEDILHFVLKNKPLVSRVLNIFLVRHVSRKTGVTAFRDCSTAEYQTLLMNLTSQLYCL